MKILIVGAGMYVTGRDNTGVGTILSSLSQTSKECPLESVTVVARRKDNGRIVAQAMKRINGAIGSELRVEYMALPGDPLKSLDALLGRIRFDCAIVAVPDHVHFEYAELLLRRDVHCLIVKPLTPTLKEASALVKLQKERQLYGMVEFHKRFDTDNLYVKRRIEEGQIGKLLYFTVDYSQRIDIPTKTFRGWVNQTNVFQYLGVHYVDLIHFLTGFLPYKVMAVGTQKKLIELGLKAYDSVHATILWRNPGNKSDQFVAQFSVNWIDPSCTSALSDQKYKVIGTSGRIECDQKNRGLEIVSTGLGIQTPNPYFAEYLYDANGRLCFCGYGHKSIGQFVRDVRDLGEQRITLAHLDGMRPSFRQALVSTAVIEAVNHSLAGEGKWVTVHDLS